MKIRDEKQQSRVGVFTSQRAKKSGDKHHCPATLTLEQVVKVAVKQHTYTHIERGAEMKKNVQSTKRSARPR